eukprot:scaffold10313_cov107-Phaeocystis_antarctica.AAC.1
MGKNRSPGLVFELPAHSTEWSGRQGDPVGRPPGRPWPPFGPARAALQIGADRPVTGPRFLSWLVYGSYMARIWHCPCTALPVRGPA